MRPFSPDRVRTRLAVLALFAAVATGLAPASASAQLPSPLPVPARPPAPTGWIGVSVEMRGTVEADGGRLARVRLSDVRPDGPAGRAGLRAGDLLLTLNGRTPEEGFVSMVGTLAPGDPVTVRIRRDGRERSFTFRAGTRPARMAGPSTYQVLVEADTLADRMYRAMDSLRLRIARGDGVDGAVVASRVHGAGVDTVITILRSRGDAGARPPLGLPSPPFPPRSGEAPVASDAAHPFRLLVLGDSTFATGPVPPTLRVEADVRRRSGPDGEELEVALRPLAPYMLGRNRAAGAEVVELKPELAEYFHVERGVLVVDVAPGTPAARAGLQPGDVLTRLGAMTVGSVAEFRAGLAQPRDSLRVSLVRKGERVELLLRR